MEFLIGRSLAANVSNLLLDPEVREACREKNVDWYDLLDQEPDAGLGNGGLGRLAACFMESMATMDLPATGYGLRYEYGIFKQPIEDGWQNEKPDNWLRRPDPWEVFRLDHIVEVKLNCSFQIRGGLLVPTPGKPSTLLGIPFDRPVIGYGGRTINTLRLWSAGAPDSFHCQRFSHGDFVGAVTETPAPSRSRASFTRTTRRPSARNCGSFKSISSAPVPSMTFSAVSGRTTTIGTGCPKKWPSS